MDPPNKKGSRPLDSRTYEGLAAFRYALRQFLAFSEAATTVAGVTTHQYQVLLVIRTHTGGAIMVRDLAEQMLMQHHSAVQMVDRLVRARLVRRRESPNDRRSVLVALTAKGARLLQQLATGHLAELQRHEPLLVESLRRLSSSHARMTEANSSLTGANPSLSRKERIGNRRRNRYWLRSRSS